MGTGTGRIKYASGESRGLTSSWQYRLARRIVHLRIYIIIACTALTVFFLSVLGTIKVETHLEDFLPQKHPFVEVQHQLTHIFGGLNQVSLALRVKKGTILNAKFLDKLISLTEDLYLVKGVNISRVYSLASRHIKHIVANEEGFFVERLLRYPPQDERGREELKRKIEINPNVYGKMVSRDFRATFIQVDFNSGVKTSYIFSTLQKLKKKYEDKNTEIYIAGRPILEGWLNFYLPSMFKVLAVSMLVISLILFFTFRSRRGILLPLLDSSMATIWGMGTMKLLGLRLDPATILVPFIVLSLGISHSVHTLKRYYEEMRNPKMKSKHAIVNTMAYLFLPGLACVFTDGFGFLSLVMVPLSTIKSMALASGLGIFANFFTSFMFTPCVLSFLHRPKILAVEREERHLWVDKMLAKISIFSLNKRAGTILITGFIIAGLLSLGGIKKIVIGDNTEGSSYLYPHSPYNRAEKFINDNFGGTNSYYILVKSSSSLLKADKLRAIDSFQRYLQQQVLQVGSSLSVVDAVKALNMFMFAGKREYFKIPSQDDVIAQYWFLYTLSGFPSDYDHLISRDEKSCNIKFDFRDHKSTTVNLAVEKTHQYFQKHKFKDIKFLYAGGDIGIFYAINDIIKKTILPNALFISLLIFFYVSFIYRSFTAGWFLLLPLVLSNLVIFSLLGFLGISITTEILPLVSLSEGLGINYGIYILARLYDEMRQKRHTYKDILHYTLITSGKAVFFSGAVVSLGILVWVFSPILFQAKLGIILCLSLVLNMVISLVMVPLLVWWLKPAFLWGRVKRRLKKGVERRGRRVSFFKTGGGV